MYSSTLAEHLDHLRLVLQVLKDNQFFVKRSKCAFRQKEVEYLGHIVSAEGVHMDQNKVKAMVEWPQPKNIKELRGFLGLTGYYRRFVRSYASIAAPSTELLKKDAFHWTIATQEAFTKLKVAMSSASVLALPNFNKDFVLETDASDYGVGALLIQNEQPLAYFSKKLSLRMQQASTYVRELYAITEAVKKWRQYLLGRRFLIRTDQKSLKALLDQVILTLEQQKCLAKLLGFQYSIVYKPEKDNRVADALSRQPDEFMALFLAISQVRFDLLDTLRHENKTSVFFLEKYRDIEVGVLSREEYEIRDGLLLFKGNLLLDHHSQLVQLVIKECFSTRIGGLGGIQKTVAKVAAAFIWSRMKRDVEHFVKACEVCQK